jgi:hypothetical protein
MATSDYLAREAAAKKQLGAKGVAKRAKQLPRATRATARGLVREVTGVDISRKGISVDPLAVATRGLAGVVARTAVKTIARRATVSALKDTIIAKGGVTINSKAMKVVSPKRGYSVGIARKTAVKIPLKKASIGNISKAFDQVQKKYNPKNMGAWVDRGAIHIDPTRIVKKYGKAQRIGREFEQKSIYSFHGNRGKGASLNVLKRGR